MPRSADFMIDFIEYFINLVPILLVLLQKFEENTSKFNEVAQCCHDTKARKTHERKEICRQIHMINMHTKILKQIVAIQIQQGISNMTVITYDLSLGFKASLMKTY